MSHAADPAASNPAGSPARTDDDARLASLGYQPQLHRVLGLFSNFAVAFTYLSPMVGIYSLFVLGLGTAGPAYVWLNWIPVIGMFFVALVFGELASHYPVAGALYQYSKFSVGAGYGWFVGWFYGFALLITVAAVDTGVVGYVASLTHNWFGWNLDATDHKTILLVTLVLLLIQTVLNITGAQVMGAVARFGVFVEIVGTLGIAVILAIHGFHHGLGYLFTTQGQTHASTNPLGLDFHGSLLAAALIAVLAPVYIYYGFESAGDISEETKDAGRQVPRAMRLALVWGGIASFVLTAALLLAIPGDGDQGRHRRGQRRRPVHPRAAAVRRAGLPAPDDHLRVLLLRHVDPGRGQPAGVLLRPRRGAARVVVDLPRAPTLRHAGQRPDRRCARSRSSSCCWSSRHPLRTSTSCSSRTRAA